MPNNKLRLYLVVFYCLYSVSAGAQNTTITPYSRFGVGDLNDPGTVRNFGMGGIGTAVNSALHINPINPASYANLVLTTFEVGASFQQIELSNQFSRQRGQTASLRYFEFAFPVKPGKWSVGFGLSPYSAVGFNVSEQALSPFGDVELRTYKGSGGLNNFHLVSGFKVAKNLSLGASAEYLFGSLRYNRTVEFGSSSYLNSNINQNTSVGWFHFNTGIQYSFDSLRIKKADSLVQIDKQLEILRDSLNHLIRNRDVTAEQKNLIRQEIARLESERKNVHYRRDKSDWNMILGLAFSPQADLRARTSVIVNNFRYGSTIVFNRDTIINVEGQKGKIIIPANISAGIGFRKGTKWLFAVDFRTQKWSKFSSFDIPDSLADSQRFSAGVQFTPNDRALKSYLKNISYRFGFSYENTYLKFSGRQLTETAVSAGLGLPVRKGASTVQLSVSIGERGTTDLNLVKERFVNFSIGFTINDRWFLKPKYD